MRDWREWSPWEQARLRWELQTRTRPNQRTPPGDWLIWLVKSGRGWGKTRTGAEDVSEYARMHPGSRQAAVCGKFAEGRDLMMEGDSGLLSVIPDSVIHNWNRSLGELIFTNGSRVDLYSAEKPDDLRGPQHHRAWCDELAKWRYLEDTWDMLQFGLRLGERPQCVITTTPKPLPLLRDLVARPTTLLTEGSLYDNADNLAPSFVAEILARYEGTRLGQQEIHGILLDDLGLLFQRRWFDIVDTSPADAAWSCGRYWDLAGTEASEVEGAHPGDIDPDWTAGVRGAWNHETREFVIEHIVHIRRTPSRVQEMVLRTAHEDGTDYTVWIEEEPGQSGKAQVDTYKRLLPDHLVKGDRPTGKKLVRAELLAQLAEQGVADTSRGKVTVVDGPWVASFLDESEVFDGTDNGPHDDQVDAASGLLKVLSLGDWDAYAAAAPPTDLRVTTPYEHTPRDAEGREEHGIEAAPEPGFRDMSV